LFNIVDRFKNRAQRIADMIKEKQDISRNDMIGKLDKLDYKFGNNLGDYRFNKKMDDKHNYNGDDKS
jgi:hypothetical protein